jgi:hypothetical protein
VEPFLRFVDHSPGVEYLGEAKSPWGTTSAGFNARTRLNRKDWGLNWNQALETGGWLVGEFQEAVKVCLRGLNARDVVRIEL